jgi:hypothetical protein
MQKYLTRDLVIVAMKMAVAKRRAGHQQSR